MKHLNTVFNFLLFPFNYLNISRRVWRDILLAFFLGLLFIPSSLSAACASSQKCASIENVTLLEGNSGTTSFNFPVTISKKHSGVSLNFSLIHISTDSSDFASVTTTPISPLVLAKGVTSGTITVNVSGDVDGNEGDETFQVVLTSFTGDLTKIDNNTAVGTITNDDTTPTIPKSASINDATTTEGDSNTTITVKVVFPAALDTDITLDYNTSNGTAISPDDYESVSTTTVNIPAGSTEHDLNFTITGDDIEEELEEFYITISNISAGYTIQNATGTVTILDDEASGCSGSIGLITLNEYQNNPNYKDENKVHIQGNYVEIKFIDLLARQFVDDYWSVTVYSQPEQDGVSILWKDRDIECTDPQYEIFQFDSNAMQSEAYVVLKDSNGNEVDILKIDDSDHYDPVCPTETFPYDIEVGALPAQNKEVYRVPDGTGIWSNLGSGSNSLGSRCKGFGDGGFGLQFTQFDAIDADENIPSQVMDQSSVPLKTKIVEQNFDVNVLSIDVETGSLKDVDVTIKTYISTGDGIDVLSPGYDTSFSQSTSTPLAIPAYDKANKFARLRFEYCEDGNGTAYNWTDCYETTVDLDRQKYSFSRDTFAIRPQNFNVNISTGDIFIAEKPVNLKFQALNAATSKSVNYNETQNNSFVIDLNVTGDCAISNLTISPSVSFQDGLHQDEFSFNDIGDVNMSIHEKDGTEFAIIDLDDTPDILRYITPYEANFTVLPDHFSVQGNFSDHHLSTDQNFTYLSDFAKNAARNAKSMASEYNLTIMAKKFDDDNASNYTSGCFAKDLNITLSYSTVTADGTVIDLSGTDLSKVQYYEKNIDIDDTYYDVNIGTDINYSFTPAIFDEDINGTALVKMNINFDRNYFTSINPFIFTLNNIALNDADSVTGADSINQNATYFSARARSSKYIYDETSSPVTTPISVVVYCDLGVTKCSQYGIDTQINEYVWYLSKFHNTSSTFDDGNITLIPSTGGSVSQEDPNIVTITSGGINNSVSVSNTSGATAHTVDITFGNSTNNWLIYNPYDNSIPIPFYKVKFIGTAGWAGHGKTGYVVDSNASTKKNRRLGW